MRAALVCLLIWLAAPVSALDLPLPDGSELTAEETRDATTIRLPSGPYAQDLLPRLSRDGDVYHRAWRLPDGGLSTLQILDPLREALEKAGWEVVFVCEAEFCGGFDFRLALPTLAAPAMFVDLFDYRYLLAARGIGERTEHLALIVSRRGRRGYVQVSHVVPHGGDTGKGEDAGVTRDPSETVQDSLGRALTTQGHAVLDGLDFGSGARTLGPGPTASLSALAEFLKGNPGARVALVGHTDSVGGLQANRDLSRGRAEAVLRRLVEAHGVSPAQLEAHGIGYLAPVAPNSTAAGRDRNRRVEAVLLEMPKP